MPDSGELMACFHNLTPTEGNREGEAAREGDNCQQTLLNYVLRCGGASLSKC